MKINIEQIMAGTPDEAHFLGLKEKTGFDGTYQPDHREEKNLAQLLDIYRDELTKALATPGSQRAALVIRSGLYGVVTNYLWVGDWLEGHYGDEWGLLMQEYKAAELATRELTM